jgi:hypothetical protein
VTSLGALVALAGCGSTHTTDDLTDAGPIVFDLDGATLPDAVIADAARPGGNVGAACRAASDCTGAANVCIPDQPGFLPGGYCTAACDVADAESCPTGSTCIEVGMGQSFCFQDCEPGASMRQCRAGYGCASNFMALPENVCVGGCSDASDCGSGQLCDPTGGLLGAGACFTPDAMLGGACTADAECPMAGACQDEANGGWPGGACIAGGCDVRTNTGCAGDGQCIQGTFGGICVDGCTSDTDCRPQYACRAALGYPDRSYCAPACANDGECTVAGYVCNTTLGTCAPPFDPTRLGGPCSFRQPCEGGSCFTERDNGYPSGYCAYVGCEPGASGGCPGDGVCATRGGRNVCLDGCAADSDCRGGYACRPSDPADPASPTACVPACTTEMHCPGRSTSCNPGTGLCLQEFDAARLGNACAGGGDCVGGTCLTEASAGWPGGTCTFPGCRISGSGPSSDCPMGAVCVDDAAGDPAIGVCVTGCGEGSTCRAGYACVEGACRPACTETSCSGGRTCDVASGLCR